MVGLLSSFSAYINPYPSFLQEREEDEISKRNEPEKEDFQQGDLIWEGSTAVELNTKFAPIEHPPQPDEDRPIKCPMPDSSLFLKDEGKWEGTFMDTLQKGSKPAESKECGKTDELSLIQQFGNKSQNSHKQERINFSSFSVPQSNFFRVFQQCKECEF